MKHINLSSLLYKNIPRKNCYFKKLYIPFQDENTFNQIVNKIITVLEK